MDAANPTLPAPLMDVNVSLFLPFIHPETRFVTARGVWPFGWTKHIYISTMPHNPAP